MLGRILLAVLLVALGVAAPIFAVGQYGFPWGFREHAAVLVESTGNIEFYRISSERKSDKSEKNSANDKNSAPAKSSSDDGSDDKSADKNTEKNTEKNESSKRPERRGVGRERLDSANGMWLEIGDEIRSSALSYARLKTPNGVIEIGDGVQATLKPDAIAIERGHISISVESDEAYMFISGVDQPITLMTGTYDVTSDGKGAHHVYVRAGEAHYQASENQPDVLAVQQQMIKFRPNEKPAVEKAPAAILLRINAETTNEAVLVKGQASAVAQVYINGDLIYPEADGSFSWRLAAGQSRVVVLARDVVGNVATQMLSLADLAPASKPR